MIFKHKSVIAFSINVCYNVNKTSEFIRQIHRKKGGSMNKFKIFPPLIVSIFVATLSANTVFASKTPFDNIIPEEIVDITAKNSKQPHMIWNLTGEDADAMITLLSIAKFSEETARQ